MKESKQIKLLESKKYYITVASWGDEHYTEYEIGIRNKTNKHLFYLVQNDKFFSESRAIEFGEIIKKLLDIDGIGLDSVLKIFN